MKFFKIAMAAVVAFGFSNAYAFHGGGVAECEGCHTMHGAADAQGFLLAGGDQSSTCLTCHEKPGDPGPSGYHISTPDGETDLVNGPKQLTPGGDFSWLRYTFSNNYVVSEGPKHGHSIKAVDNVYPGPIYPVGGYAPGSTYYNDDNFGCHSCHDPHGKYRRATDNPGVDGAGYVTTGGAIQKSGSYNTGGAIASLPAGGTFGAYRILAGKNYAPKSYAGAVPFVASPPTAVAPSTYNRTEGATQTTVVYGAGMSEWCANCHDSFLTQTAGMGEINHPAGNSAILGGMYVFGNAYGGTDTIDVNYNAYVKSGDMSGIPSPNDAGGYTSLVPFEKHDADFTVLQPLSGYGKPALAANNTASNVMCLSCHRAHASAFDHMLRYDYGNEFMTVASSGATVYPLASSRPGQGRSETIRQKAYYDRAPTVFAAQQRVLCNKCHAKD